MIVRSVRTVLLGLAVLVMSSAAFAQLRISVNFGPPALPVYEQPLCPGDGYIWTPGYWGWDDVDQDYYWVPGTWVLPPDPNLLWTPPYWGWSDGAFVFYDGYWAPQVGFYGGIDYGFGYYGDGFDGGRWDHGHFYYNRAVNNINVREIHNVYNTTVVNNAGRTNRVSYWGGNGGIDARPTAQQEAVARERHVPPAAGQVQQVQAARSNPEFRAATNHGKPPVAATARPTEFKGNGAVAAREAGAPYRAPANREVKQPNAPAENSRTATHPNELPPMQRPAAPNTGNAKLDKKYQQQQQKMMQKQEQQRQKLQQKQDKEHQQMARQSANAARQQQMEQRHQQQTQHLQQRQTQEQQRMQQRQAPRPAGPPKK
ncbi:MAG TPA: hypothetical protein VMB66_15780 [Candidatus Acidoferrales bacterium]|nr:hypothetical protein [Candidatus Acidoferrales bacterium]